MLQLSKTAQIFGYIVAFLSVATLGLHLPLILQPYIPLPPRPTNACKQPTWESPQAAILGVPYDDQPEWLSNHVRWLGTEARRLKKSGYIHDWQLGATTYTPEAPTCASTLILQVGSHYQLKTNTAFKVGQHAYGTALLILQPNYQSGNNYQSDEFRKLQIATPLLENTESLLILFRIESKDQSISDPLDLIVHARFEKGG